MLSEKGFKFHLDNIEHYAKWMEYYGDDAPELREVAKNSVETSKQVLMSYFKRKEGIE
jgi:hypothetical protein